MEGTHSSMHPGAQPLALADIPASALACGLACSRRVKHPGQHPDAHPDMPPGMQEQLAKIWCENGLNPVQINVLGVILRLHRNVISYSRIATELFASYGMKRTPSAVRGIISRLERRRLFEAEQAREGTIQGNRYTLMKAFLCPHIKGSHPDAHPGIHADTHPAMQACLIAPPSILKQKERNILSSYSEDGRAQTLLEALTEDAIAFHWPQLARKGFGTVQVRQILERLSEVGRSALRVMTGLAHAEWELAHNCMHDAKGNPVEQPVSWVFAILAKDGYYPRPKEFVSPEEQAERDAEVEAKSRAVATEARMSAECEAWRHTLKVEDIQRILPANHIPMIDSAREALLRRHFREHFWPEIVSAGGSKP